jgi:MFS family permease
MNQWRLIILLLVAASLILIAAASWFAWEPWNSFSVMSERWQGGPSNMRHTWADNPPNFLVSIAAFFTMYFCGILVLFTLPSQIRCMKKELCETPVQLVRITLLGMLTIILVGIIGVTSAITVGTFPLTIILGTILFLSSFVGFVALAFTLGHNLLQRGKWLNLSPFFALLLGLLILYALNVIPILGILVKALLASIGVGLIITTRFGSGQPWNISPLMED